MSDELDYVIEENVPIPSISRESKYPWESLEVGQSVFFPGEEAGTKAAQSARSWFSRREPGYTVITRTMDGGTRIWKVAVEDGEEEFPDDE